MADPVQISSVAFEAAGRAIINALSEGDNKVTLRNGVVLQLKPLPPYVLQDAQAQIKEPEIPVWHNEERGRDEPNPNDPDYLEALEKTAMARLDAVALAAMALGTEIIFIPDGITGPDDDSWLQNLAFLGIKVPETPLAARYVAWLRYYALATKDDIAAITGIPLLLAGIGEGEVNEALESFRSAEERGTNNGLSSGGNGKNGHNVRTAPARGGVRNRRARSG